MFETYRQLGREHDAELQREAARRALARTVRRRPLHPVAVLIGAILLLAFTLALVLPACSLGNHRDAGAISTSTPGTSEPAASAASATDER
jgi:hypothetical protein